MITQRNLIGAFFFVVLLSAGCGNGDVPGKDGVQPSYFTEINSEVGLDFVHNPGVDSSYFMPESIGSGAAFLDYDNDGRLDIYLVNGQWHNPADAHKPRLRNRLFRQESDGRFTDVTEATGAGDTGYGMGVAVGDIDNDGWVDLYVSNYGPDALYRNNGDGTFSDVSQTAGIGNPHWGCSAVFFDYNLDGFLDIYVTNYVDYDPSHVCMDQAGRPDYCGPAGFSGVPDVLYRNNGDGTFSDVSWESGTAAGRSKGLGVVAADFNGDLYPDLYVANDGEPNHLWINQRDGTFADRALSLGAAVNNLGQAEAGMGIALGDVENDGDLDLFITHLRTESNTLYRRAGDIGFVDDSAVSGLAGPSLPYTGFGAGFFDYDNDGDLDLAVVNGRVTRGPLLTNRQTSSYWDPYAEPNMFFENDGTGKFSDISPRAALFTQMVENSRGLAFGDVDNDGDVDLLVANEGGPARLYRNDTPDRGHWLTVRVVDPELRRDAVGAVVTVVTEQHEIARLVAPGYSYLSSNDPRVHFGLGEAAHVEEIRVRWPDGTLETFPGGPADRFLRLEKGQRPSAP